MLRVLLIVCAALLLSGSAVYATTPAAAVEEAAQDLSLCEVGSRATISSEAAGPLQEIAHLLVDANDSVRRLAASREPLQLLNNNVRLHTHTNIVLAKKAPKLKKKSVAKVTAELANRLQQPTIHDAQRFGTKYPVNQEKAGWVNAQVLGEDGKPYKPRKQWKGIQDDNPMHNLRSPFAKFIHPPAVVAAADIATLDTNKNLTPLERKGVEKLQFRLKRVLDNLGANIVWDHSPVKNRRIIADFENLKTEARALMEEYELRTGVKTIAWQLGKPDFKGLDVPNGSVKDIYFGKNPELRQRLIQRKGTRKYPPPPTEEMKARALKEKLQAEAAKAAGLNDGMKKAEQAVTVGWRKGADGVVRAKVKFDVVDTKVPNPYDAPNVNARSTVEGKLYPSGRRGSQSQPVSITVLPPGNEALMRTEKEIAKPAETPAPKAALIEMNL
jgi:hypothetical protein